MPKPPSKKPSRSKKSSKKDAVQEPPDDYEVGYGCPPLHTRFQKGKSGNPSGRPKGSRNLSSIVNAAIKRKVTIVENGRTKKMSVMEVVIHRITTDAAKGNGASQRLLMPLAMRAEDTERARALADEESQDPRDKEITKLLVERLRATEKDDIS